MRSRKEMVEMLEKGNFKILAAPVGIASCSACADPIFENEETFDDGDGVRHRNPGVCLDNLHSQQRALERMCDEQRRVIILLQNALAKQREAKAKRKAARK